MNLRRRVAGGFAVLCALFLALVFVQFAVAGRLQTEHEQRTDRIERMLDDNRAVLQYMTDAETGVRGFQLTGDPDYLISYAMSRDAAYLAFADLISTAPDAALRTMIEAERQAATDWMDAYATPIVDVGAADASADRAATGKRYFDVVRSANAAVNVEVNDEQKDMAAADRRTAQRVQLLFGALAGLVLLTGMTIALLHQRHLLRPLADLQQTLRRLASGDLSARVDPTGPPEMHAVAATINDLAAETERLLGAEQARAATGELRQKVATELRSGREPAEAARRVAELIGPGMGADAVHIRLAVDSDAGVAVIWPPDAPPLDPDVVRQVREGEVGASRTVPEVPGGLAVTLSGDDRCRPGLILLSRAGQPDWTAAERRLLRGLSRDVDYSVRQQRLQLRQVRLIGELRVLDAQKDVFVSTVTHELRTPLTSILGYTEMLTDEEAGELSPMQRRGLGAILRNAHRLEATVADLLLLDRSNERVGAEAAPIDLAATLTGVHDTVSEAARAKDIRGEVDVEPAWVRGDGAQLEHALRKLVDNAIKFTPAGGRFELRLATEGRNAVVTVADTGMGIPAEDLPGLFTPFHRGANAMDQAVQGPGLGLAIVRSIVTEHGGTVTATSELGQGSTFTVILPAVIVTEPAHS
jgi:signal transduction histidine kinase/CHASE3 domain sensor protein